MIYILIPTFNDSENFEALFRNISKSLKTKLYKIIMVDDGSTDRTNETVSKLTENYPVARIGYSKNKGPGYAFNFGFNYLTSKLQNNDLVITIEADNTSDLSVLGKMITMCKDFDVVLSSPYAKGGKFLGIGKDRMILGLGASILDRLIFRIKGVKTYSSFYRAYKASIIKKAKSFYKTKLITENGFSSVVELLIKLAKLDAKITEVPATVDWRKRRGVSKMKIGKTILRHLLIYKNYLTGKYN